MLIVVGSTSALKLRGSEVAVQRIAVLREDFRNATVRGEDVASGVPNQPFGLEQMFAGAENRARGALAAPGADVGIGIENGLVEIEGRWYDPPAVVVISRKFMMLGRALGAALPIPTRMVDEVREQKSELGHIIQQHAGGGEKDPHKYLSKGLLDRETIVTQAVLSAFAVILNPYEYAVVNPNE